MKFKIEYSITAFKDLRQISDYLELLGSYKTAIDIVTRLTESVASLDELPQRGHVVPELSSIGVGEYKEVHYGMFRIIYFIDKKKVVITGILDSRRDVKQELERRILNF